MHPFMRPGPGTEMALQAHPCQAGEGHEFDTGVKRLRAIRVEAQQVMTGLQQAGISLDAVTAKLLDKGLKIFSDSFERLSKTLAAQRQAA
jgi:hypothetical protein